MNCKEKEMLIPLSNGDWINPSTVTAIRCVNVPVPLQAPDPTVIIDMVTQQNY